MATHAVHNIHAFSYSLNGDGEDMDSMFLAAEVYITFKTCAMGQVIFMGKKASIQKKKKKKTTNEMQIFHMEVIYTHWGHI